MTLSLIILITAIIVWYFAVSAFERKLWNNGKCPKCGERWKNFDTDSQGGRGYKCPKCDRTIWMSYNSVDKDS